MAKVLPRLRRTAQPEGLHDADLVITPGQELQRGSGWPELAGDRLRLAVAFQGCLWMSEVRHHGVPFHVPDFFVCGRELQEKRGIGTGCPRQAVQILARRLHQQLPRLRRAGQALDLRVQIEQHRVSELVDLLEAELGPARLAIDRHHTRQGPDQGERRQ